MRLLIWTATVQAVKIHYGIDKNMIGYLIVAAIAIILIGFTAYGARRGIIYVVFSLGATIIAMFTVSYISPHVTNFLIEHTSLYETIYGKVEGILDEENGRRDTTTAEGQEETINAYALPDTVKSLLIKNNQPEVYDKYLVSAFEDYSAAYLTRFILNVISYVITFLLVMLVLKILIHSLNLLDRLPLLHGMNHLAGAVAGFVEGALVVWLIFFFMTAIMGTDIGQRFLAVVKENAILRFIYNNNIFFHLLREYDIKWSFAVKPVTANLLRSVGRI